MDAARPLAPDDIKPGLLVCIFRIKKVEEQIIRHGPDDTSPMRVTRTLQHSLANGTPLYVNAVALPFVACAKIGCNMTGIDINDTILDLRDVDLCELPRPFVEALVSHPSCPHSPSQLSMGPSEVPSSKTILEILGLVTTPEPRKKPAPKPKVSSELPETPPPKSPPE